LNTKQKILKNYGLLIVREIEILTILKKGNYEFKAAQIINCERDIEFYKMMRKKLS